jgi:RNA polymerase sigma-70 factor (ECF subfamily)
MATIPESSHTDRLLLHLLVVRCQAGDEDAFVRLLEQFGPRTLRYLQRLVGEEAEDVHQEVWLGVYRRISQLASPGAFVTWLFSVARNGAVDHLRRRRRARELLDDVAAESMVQGEYVTGEQMAASDVADRIDATELSVLIAALPPLHREVILLRYQEELSYAEIAAVVGRSIGTVKSRLHHARRLLQESAAHSCAGLHASHDSNSRGYRS